MATKPSGTTVPRHGAPFSCAEFSSIRLKRDPDEAYAAVCRILAETEDPSEALEACSEHVDGFGVESLSLADGDELHYVNRGDTYDATLCYTESRGYFVSSWGDVYEEADREHEEESGERRCAYCSEWSEPGEPCGSCGRDPETGDAIPEPLRHVRLETGHVLRTWETDRPDGRGRCRIGYELTSPGGERIFRGQDFRCSPLLAVDSDACLRALLGFLTLRPGDTDAEYFEGYNATQRAFAASSYCETLQYLYSEDGPGAFVDLDCDNCGAPVEQGKPCPSCGHLGDTGDPVPCECADKGCPCGGSCAENSAGVLYRVDMDDATGTAFCERCMADALASGLFAGADDAEGSADA